VIFLDTSYLVALAVPADGLHDAAMAWTAATSGPFITTEFVLLEFVNLLSSPIHRPKAHGILSSIYGNSSIHVVPATAESFQRGLALHGKRLDKSWSLTDCISFEVMREANATDSLTHDQHFEQAGFRALLRRMPPG
jgi:predicted nucleic acid-binding protein